MGIDRQQFRELIVRPILKSTDLWSESAENLMVGTAVIESELTYLKQTPSGPAISIMQIEPFTYSDLAKRLTDNFELYHKVKSALYMDIIPPYYCDWLIGNMNAAVIFARLKYYFDPEPLPDALDHEALAAYYKRVYNTSKGAASLKDAITIFRSSMLNYMAPGVQSVKLRMAYAS